MGKGLSRRQKFVNQRQKATEMVKSPKEKVQRRKVEKRMKQPERKQPEE